MSGNVRIVANDRDDLEHVARYIACPPIANERLTALPDGRIARVGVLSLGRGVDGGARASLIDIALARGLTAPVLCKRARSRADASRAILSDYHGNHRQ